MRTKIFYFSGTGNSLSVAKNLATELGQNTEIVFIPKVLNSDINIDADRIGLVFPIYAWGPPNIVARFIERIKGKNTKSNTYFFTVVTGGGFPAASLIKTQEMLEKSGVTQSLGMFVRMPGNYIPLYGAWAKEKQIKMFEKGKKKIRLIAEMIKNKAVKIEKNFFLINMLGSLMYNKMMPNLNKTDKEFWINDKCTDCGICNKICPVQNIKVENKKRTWLGKCEQCMSCIQWCPVGAIEFGKKTQGKGRYHHPDIKITDLI